MVVAMIAVRVMQVAVHEIINMITMRDRFVAAIRAMLVIAIVLATLMLRRAAAWIAIILRELVLINMIAVRMMNVRKK
jgi:hypothetical protein